MNQTAPLPTQTRSAGWLSKIMAILQGFFFVMGILGTLYLVVCFPLWWKEAPGFPLPIMVNFTPATELVATIADTPKLENVQLDQFTGLVNAKIISAWAQWVYLLYFVVIIFLAVLSIRIFRQLIGSISNGDVFNHKNTKRLRWLGMLFLAGAIYEPTGTYFFSKWAVDGLSYAGGTLSAAGLPDNFMDGFITGWVLLILSEIFRQGTDMQQEQSLTI